MQLEPITLAMPERLAEIYNSAERPSFDIRAEADDEKVELRVYGIVGDDWDENSVSAGSVAAILAKNKGKPVAVRINSPGGLAWDGVTIHNALIQHDGPVETVVEGSAGSAATIIAVAGRPAKMFANGRFFVHKASALSIGNSDLMMEAAEWLDGVDQAIARTYAARTGNSVETALRHMSGEGKKDGTTFSAEQAKRAGYVDEIISLGDAHARNDGGDVVLADEDDAIREAEKAEYQRLVNSRLRNFAKNRAGEIAADAEN